MGAALAALFFTHTASAEPITLPSDWQSLPEWQTASEDRGGTLLLSDCPEMAPRPGILYRDTVKGDVRLFLYHVNDTRRPKRIAALITNESDSAADIRVTRWADSEPSEDWLAVGRDTQLAYLSDAKTDRIILAPHETRILTRSLENKWIQPNQLVHTIHDFTTDQEVTVTVVMAPLIGRLERFAERADVLPPDSSRLRGTFREMDRYVTAQPYDAKKDGACAITLADNRIDDYVWGIDATDGTRVQNYGNYGIVYHIDAAITRGKASAYLNPQGGLYAGGILIEDKRGTHLTQTPDNEAGYFGIGTTTDAEALGTFQKKRPLKAWFSPPGASNLPVRLLLIPED